MMDYHAMWVALPHRIMPLERSLSQPSLPSRFPGHCRLGAVTRDLPMTSVQADFLYFLLYCLSNTNQGKVPPQPTATFEQWTPPFGPCRCSA